MTEIFMMAGTDKKRTLITEGLLSFWLSRNCRKISVWVARAHGEFWSGRILRLSRVSNFPVKRPICGKQDRSRDRKCCSL